MFIKFKIYEIKNQFDYNNKHFPAKIIIQIDSHYYDSIKKFYEKNRI